jgi:hypothetical protein
MSDSVMREGIRARRCSDEEDGEGEVEDGLEEGECRERKRLGHGGMAACWWRGQH